MCGLFYFKEPGTFLDHLLSNLERRGQKMRKISLMIVTLALWAGFSSVAQADYSIISIGYNTARTHDANNACYHDMRYSRNDNRHLRHSPRIYYRYNSYPYYHPVVLRPTVVYQKEDQDRGNQEKFGISDVIVLSQAGVSDRVIMEKIRKTRSVFNLSVEEVEALRKEGVSPNVINYMLNTNR
jgi:hypothetical protein